MGVLAAAALGVVGTASAPALVTTAGPGERVRKGLPLTPVGRPARAPTAAG